jgi:hypothetical protein
VTTELPLRAGDLWLNDQCGKHGGWAVRVPRMTPPSVGFEVVRGLSRSLESRHRRRRRALVRDFEPRTAA